MFECVECIGYWIRSSRICLNVHPGRVLFSFFWSLNCFLFWICSQFFLKSHNVLKYNMYFPDFDIMAHPGGVILYSSCFWMNCSLYWFLTSPFLNGLVLHFASFHPSSSINHHFQTRLTSLCTATLHVYSLYTVQLCSTCCV